ncbi:MAG TPA: hypothetical protein VLY46_03865, partial [Usitatibacter sp.]|nr:hypothetical protein [Usitatibacter sp.]
DAERRVARARMHASLRPVLRNGGIAGAVLAVVVAAWLVARIPGTGPAPVAGSAAPQLKLDYRLDLARLAKRGS